MSASPAVGQANLFETVVDAILRHVQINSDRKEAALVQSSVFIRLLYSVTQLLQGSLLLSEHQEDNKQQQKSCLPAVLYYTTLL